MALQPLQLTQPIAFKIPVDRPNIQAQAISGEFNLLARTLNQMQPKINELEAANVSLGIPIRIKFPIYPLQLTQPIAFKISVDRPNLQAQAISRKFNLLITTLNQTQIKINELEAANVSLRQRVRLALQPLQLTQPRAFKIPVDRPNLQAQAISREFNLLVPTLNQMQTKINELKAANVLFERNRTGMIPRMIRI